MHRLILLNIIGLGLLLQSVGEARKAPLAVNFQRVETVSLVHGGLTRTAFIVVPSGYRASSAIPLVLSFHGRDSRGTGQAWLTDMHTVGERENFIVAYPDGVGGSWNALHETGEAQALGIDDVGFVDALIANLSARFAINPDRIYATGMSNGGFFAHRLGCERSDRFAAIAAVAGGIAPALEQVCRPEKAMAVMMIHGKADPIVPYFGGMTGGGGSVLSADQAVAVWNRLNRSTGVMEQTLKQGDVTCRSSKDGVAPVTLCSIETAGHTWPAGNQYGPESLVGTTNQDINASESIWQFFSLNPRTAKRVKRPSPPTGLRVVR